LPAVFRVAMNEIPRSALDALKCSEMAPGVRCRGGRVSYRKIEGPL
jgi:hypothetical protein